MSTTLVTGATGLVGHSIANALRLQGRDVRVMARDPERARALVPEGCEVVAGDVTGASAVEAALTGCDEVFHSAGIPEQWLADSSRFQRVNVEGTRNMVEAALSRGVSKFVYTSTQDVFAADNDAEFDESVIDEDPKGTPYQRSKQEADRIVTEAVGRGLPAVTLHPAAVYGPGPTASPGMNGFFADLVRGKIPLLLAGGMPLVYADDVGEGHLLAADKAKPGSRFLLSEGYYTLSDLAEAVQEATGSSKIPPVMPVGVAKAVSAAGEFIARFTKRPPLIPKGQLHGLLWGAKPRSTKARNELGWRPKPLSQGLRATLAYLDKRGYLA